MLSLETTLAERLQYDPQNVSHDELHDMALDLEAWRKLGDSPQDVQDQIEQRDEYKAVLVNIREAIKNGESLEYLASLLPDNLED